MRIKEVLKEQGLTQKELAKRMGVSDAVISQIISGRFSPTLDTLQRIATALNVDVAELFTPVAKCPYCGRIIALSKKD